MGCDGSPDPYDTSKVPVTPTFDTAEQYLAATKQQVLDYVQQYQSDAQGAWDNTDTGFQLVYDSHPKLSDRSKQQIDQLEAVGRDIEAIEKPGPNVLNLLSKAKSLAESL
ncbi:hypothetical protein Pan189_32040 [Stratiformator vulcanicus]|uniref:Uncharacterized protein n=2 Tax=Stratiformator vulcanicus TaxID=2527980 RepID=A0A517R4J2_9PLAN|nr:hypothetical protein Pan189_32040 [Stratiformator vulcanicus]